MPPAPTAKLPPLLTRPEVWGAGWRSRPAGASIGFTSGVLFSELSFGVLLTGDLHFLGLLTGTEYELRSLKQPIDDVCLLMHTVVGHFALPIWAQHNHDPCLTILDLGA